jgi:hypothetical protein
MADEIDEKTLANDGRTKFRVWWIPQVPMDPFIVEVASYAEGKKIEDVLADYDRFQFEKRVKGDYCNAGGVSMLHPEITGTGEDDWMDVDDMIAEDYGWKEPED